MNAKILGNYKVIDLTDEQGAFGAKLLADMGAEVTRIVAPGTPRNQDFDNGGKQIISLNIETIRGRDLLEKLVKDTDILIESFPPGYLDSLGLGYAVLKRTHSRLIMASITPYGQTGPYRNYKTSELVASAAGGRSFICGEPGKPPLKPAGPQAFYTAGLFAANGILLALFQRHKSNQGQFIDISIHECAVATLDHVLVRYFYEGAIAQRQGSLYWNHSFRIFHCRDGYILLSWSQNWETLIEWMDSEGLSGDLKDPRWQDESVREQNIVHIIEVVERWTLTHTVDELLETGQLMRFPWARVASIPEVVNSPQLKERGFFIEATDSETGRRFQVPGAPVKMSVSNWNIDSRNPFGEINDEVYKTRLGLNDEEIAVLKREGVI